MSHPDGCVANRAEIVLIDRRAEATNPMAHKNERLNDSLFHLGMPRHAALSANAQYRPKYPTGHPGARPMEPESPPTRKLALQKDPLRS